MATWDELEQKYSAVPASQPAQDSPWSSLEQKYAAPAPQESPQVMKAAAAPAKQNINQATWQQYQNAKDQGARDLVGGLLSGAGSIGATILWPIDKAMDVIKGDRGPNVSGLVTGKQPMSRNEERRMQINQGLRELGVDTESLPFQGSKIATQIAGTSGVGGALGALSSKVAPNAPIISNALSSGGFNLGDAAAKGAGFLPWLQNMGARVAGGAVTGGASAGLVNPNDAPTGAVVGGVLPPAVGAVNATGRWIGNTAKSLIQPFTESGQNAIVGNILNKAAQGGPTTINATELVPGSMPTLAEAMGNAKIAGLQRVARDINPNPFAELEKANAAARSAALEKVSGNELALEAAKNSRSTQAGALYNQAMSKGVDPSTLTPQVVGEITDLMSRPAMKSAAAKAKEMAQNAGIQIDDAGSMAGMHYTKMALDDQIGAATRAGNNTEARILLGVKDKLGNLLENISPDYMQASRKFAELSQPVNQMEVLQGLKLTDQMGKITLSKIQSNIDSLEKAMKAPGINPAKSLTADQLGALRSIRDDLLRQQNLNLGKSAGSNTFQNIATNNILENALPFGLGKMATNKVGPVLGQLGRIPYSGANEAIRNKLADAFLDPTAASALMSRAALADSSGYGGLLGTLARPQPVIMGGLLNNYSTNP